MSNVVVEFEVPGVSETTVGAKKTLRGMCLTKSLICNIYIYIYAHIYIYI